MSYNKQSFLEGLAVGRNISGRLWIPKYAMLDYISSDGNQWIETGIYVKPVYTVSVTVALNRIPDDWATVFGTRDANAASVGGSRYTVRFHNTSDELEWQRSSTSANSYQTVVVSGIKNSFLHTFRTVSIANTQAILDGTVVGTFDTASSDLSFDRYPLMLLALNSAGNIADKMPADFRGGTVLDENGTPLAVYVPAQRTEDAAVGVFETVSGRFIPGSGTGSFVPHFYGRLV